MEVVGSPRPYSDDLKEQNVSSVSANVDKNLGSALAVKVPYTFTFERDSSIYYRVDGFISSEHNIFPSVKLTSPLTDNNSTFFNLLTTKNLDAETLGL